MSYYLAPIANQQQIDANGNPLSGGKISAYIAGTSTPAATYTDASGATPQANPIILNSRGLPASPVWLQGGRSYKFVVTDANDVQLQVVDNLAGINDTTGALDQWVVYANAPSYISATSFSVVGDQTLIFQVGRRLKTANTGGTIYSTIATASYSGGVTTITVANDSGTLDSGLSSASYGLISPSSSSLPVLQSLGTSGWRKRFGGSIEQWGSIAVTAGTPQSVTFPIAFPNACFAVSGIGGTSSTTADRYASIYLAAPSKTGFSVVTNGAANTIYWTALGD